MPTKIWSRNLLIVCLFIQGWLIFFHFFLAYHETPSVQILGQAFDFTRESTLPTFFSSLLAFFASIAAFAVYTVIQKSARSRVRKGAWLLAGSIFLFIAIDDSMGFHERLGSITSIGILKSLQYSSYPWHITVAPAIAICLLFASFMIWREIRSVEGLRPMLLLALGCFAAGFGIDYFEGTQLMGLEAMQSSSPPDFLPFLMLIEEVMEMAGTVIFLYVIATYLSHLVTDVEFTILDGFKAEAKTAVKKKPQLDLPVPAPVFEELTPRPSRKMSSTP